MKIIHISDNHSVFYPLLGKEEVDCIIHTGDLFPNRYPQIKSKEIAFQEDWVRNNIENFKLWIGNTPFIYVAGNHDYADPCPILKDAGINAINASNKIVEINGYKIYGFPYVPYIGRWNNEKTGREMAVEMNKVVDILNSSKIDIFASHCPPYGIFDETHEGFRIGNTELSNAISYRINPDNLPRYFLFGHCHQGVQQIELEIHKKKTYFSNAATSQVIIEIK